VGVNLVFLQVSPKFITIFPMLPNPIPYSESESLLLVTLPLHGVFFLDHLLKLVQFLAQVCKRLLCGIGFLSTFLGGAKIGFFCSVYLEPMAISSIVHGVHGKMLLAKVAMFLCTSFLWNSGLSVSTRSLCPLFLGVQSFLVWRSIGSFLATYTLNSLKRQEKQIHVHGSPTFLVKVELILPQVWAHLENVSCQTSLGKGHVHGNCGRLHVWAVVPAEQLQDVVVELLHMLHKLTNADAQGFL
jgi:hypothetical protein